jgi:hypothetical protein
MALFPWLHHWASAIEVKSAHLLANAFSSNRFCKAVFTVTDFPSVWAKIKPGD